MRVLLPLATLALLSCADPSLSIHFLVPDPYEAQVESASLAIVVPPQGAPFDCDDVAFSYVDEEQVRANTVEEILLRADNKADSGSVPREGEKLLVARGFNAAGEELVAGCAAFGIVDGDAKLELSGEIVTLASIPEFDPQQIVARATDVRITDVFGQSASQIQVRWTTTAPGAESITTSALSNQDGVVSVQVAQVPLPGPVAVDVRARWARSAPPIITGFKNPPILFADNLPSDGSDSVRNPDEIYQVGRVGPNGEEGLVAMGAPETGLSRRAYVAFFDPTSRSFQTQVSELLPPNAASLALLTDGNRERVFTTSATAIVEILNDGSLVSTPFGEPIPLIRRFFPLGDCTAEGGTEELLATFLNGETAAIRGGAFVDSMFAGDSAPGIPIASGCLSSGGTLHRAVVYTAGSDVTLLVDIEGPRKTAIGVIPAGLSFSREAAGEDALLIANTLGIEGTDIVRFRAVPIDDDKLDVELVTSDATPTFAQSTDSGDFDGDGIVDIAAVLVFGDTGEATDYRIYISLGLETAFGRVIGVSGGKTGQRPRIFVRDFNGDGHDDILVGSNGAFEIFSMAP